MDTGTDKLVATIRKSLSPGKGSEVVMQHINGDSARTVSVLFATSVVCVPIGYSPETKISLYQKFPGQRKLTFIGNQYANEVVEES